ncbi:MAG: T9SS type A sorting domain-containing protein [Chitinophagaceae bacterium]|nr:T9SS type A sorting domain-containing protein [Chitinophagaceae bacterium]
MNYLNLLGLLILLAISPNSYAQCPGWTSLLPTDSLFTNPAFGIATSPELDKLNRPYTYLATVSGGVKIYDQNTSGTPALMASVPKSSLGNLDAINLFQDSIWLYVVLGNIWNTSEMAGLAIINVSNPSAPVVTDVYTHPGLTGGAGAVITRGVYAYLAANQNGLIILNISDKNNIQLSGALPLANNFPHANVGLTSMYNARGIALKDNYAYVCYDRGGLRIIDISNVNTPVQMNQYCYAPLINKATAYNNITIHHQHAYVTLDYYGMEILDITDPGNITQLGWWHPSAWADTTNDLNVWAASNGHANEIAYDSVCQKVYTSAGKSDLVAIDVSNPSSPVTCETYGATTDDYGTWGLDFLNQQIAAAYIWSIAAPPYSNYTGYKIVQKNCVATGISFIEAKHAHLEIFPNPSSNELSVMMKDDVVKEIKIFDMTGKMMARHTALHFSIQQLPAGFYVVVVDTDDATYRRKFIKE